MLARRLDREKLEYDYISLFDEGKVDRAQYLKYDVKSTPILLTFYESGEVCGQLSSSDDIIEYFKQIKDAQNFKISLGNPSQTFLVE